MPLAARITELEDELRSHRRAAMLLMLEFVSRRPAEREHLIALLEDLAQSMEPKAAALAQVLLSELRVA